FEPDELSSDLGEALVSAFRPAILDDHGPPFDPTQLVQTLRESGGPLDLSRSRGRAREPNGGQPGRLLRARCQRPRRCRAAEKRDELAPLHSITSSARASRLSGTARSSAFVACRLITNSNLVDCTTGSSDGLAPLRIFAA